MGTSATHGRRRWSPSRKHENVYIDTSAYTAKRYPPELVAYMKSRSGRQKVMFGTNYPMVFPQQALEHLDELGLDSETGGEQAVRFVPSSDARIVQLYRLAA